MEKKSFCVCLLILFIAQISFARQDDDSTLDFLIRNKGIYTQVKEQEISRIKHKKNTSISKKQLYEINKQLYYEYKTFISDSAIFYAVENLRIAESLNDEKAKLETKLILAATYSVAGMFFEGLDLLKSINPKKLQPDLLVSYYDTYKLLYGYYSQNNIHTSNYLEKSASYRDSLLQVLDPQSTHCKIVFSEKLFDSNRLAEAKDILIALLNDTKEESHLKAVLAYALANIYKKEGNIEMQKKYYTISAISDIKNNIKENASLQALATVLYNTGDIERAYQCIKSSMEDAIFCNAHLRTFEISRIFPIIDKAYQDKALKQKNELKTFLILISILSFFLILAVVMYTDR